MSIHDNQEIEARDKRRGKKKTTPPWRAQGSTQDAQDWADVDPLLIAYVVAAVSGAGGSVQFTRTRDGGALGVRVYDDSIKTATEWGRAGEGLEDLLYLVADHYQKSLGKEVRRWT